MGAFNYELDKLTPGVSYEDYAATEGLRASDLKHLKRSPAHLVAALEAPRESTEALEFGKMFHFAMESPERFRDLVAVEPEVDRRTKIGQAALQEFRQKLASDRIVIKSKWADPLMGMLTAASNHRLVGRLLKGGVRETSLWVRDPVTGLVLKCRPDFISERGQIIDLKTTTDASMEHFLREIYSDRTGDRFYVLSAAHYAYCARLSRQCSGESLVYIAIEKEAPYGIGVYPLDEGAMGPGEEWRAYLTKQYAECLAKGSWPCYDERAKVVFPPQWCSVPPGEIGAEEVGF